MTDDSPGEHTTHDTRSSRVGRWWWLAGLAIAAVVVIVLAPLASPDPDGLEAVAQEQGFIENVRAAFYELLPDYTVPGIEDSAVSTVVSGLIGVVAVFGLMLVVGWLLRRRHTA